MTISLYAASVGSYLQIVPAASALLDKAAEHFAAQGADEVNAPRDILRHKGLPLGKRDYTGKLHITRTPRS